MGKYLETLLQYPIPKGFKHCYKCNRTLSESEFHRDKNSRDGLQNKCKKCLKQIDKTRIGYHNQYIKKLYGTKKYKARTRMRDSLHLYPLTEFCELCPEDELNKATQHHHPDYDYPTIYVSVCSQCHAYLK